jgi:hypothetical protein
MSISDFINDPFGSVAKAGLEAAPDGVRETLHDMAASTENADSVDLGQYINEHGIAGPGVADLAVGEETGPDVRSMMPIFGDDKSDPYQLGGGETSQPYVDTSSPEIIHPDPLPDSVPEPSTAGDDAAGYGASGEAGGDAFDIF